MKNIKKIGIIILFVIGGIIATATTAFVALAVSVLLDDSTISTTDISDYNTEEYSLEWFSIFPETIPKNAEVLDFLYYKYAADFYDYYLELKFDTPEELLEYLSIRIETVESKFSNRPYTFEEGVFVEEQNPYDASYVDLFFADSYKGKAEGKCYAGYTIEGPDRCLDVRYSMISYSIDELIVIHEYVDNINYYTTDRKLPKYFTRFGVDPNTEIDRWVEFQKIYKNKTDDE